MHMDIIEHEVLKDYKADFRFPDAEEHHKNNKV